jgi:hypothetical protein
MDTTPKGEILWLEDRDSIVIMMEDLASILGFIVVLLV